MLTAVAKVRSSDAIARCFELALFVEKALGTRLELTRYDKRLREK